MEKEKQTEEQRQAQWLKPAFEKGTIHWARIKGMHRSCGIYMDEVEDKVFVSQKWLYNGQILNKKELWKRARSLYPDKETHLVVQTFPLNVADVTPQWVKEQIERYDLKPSDLVNNLALTREEVGLFLNGKQSMPRFVKAMFFYYFIALGHKKRVFDECDRAKGKEVEKDTYTGIRAEEFGRKRAQEEYVKSWGTPPRLKDEDDEEDEDDTED